MRPTALAALALLLPPLSALAQEAGHASPRPVGSVAVYRGSSASMASPVAVYRGSAAPPGYLVATPPAAPVAAVGGQRIWFVDPAAGALTGCRLVATYTVGVNRVRCATTGLPVE